MMNIDLAKFLILALATYRLALLITQEKGPFGIFRRIRAHVGIVHEDDGTLWMIPDGFWPELLSCVWCSSVWIGIFFAVLFYFFPIIIPWLALPFALSAVAVVLEKG